jgi:excisionase family DNA binding protein
LPIATSYYTMSTVSNNVRKQEVCVEERHYSLSEVARILGKSERTIRRWIKLGTLRAYKPGRDFLIPESALRELMEESEVPKAEPPLPFNQVTEEREDQGERRTPTAAEMEQVTAELERLIAQRRADIERWRREGIDALEQATCGAFEMDRANEQMYRDLRALGADEVIKRRHAASAEDVDAAYRQTNAFGRLIGIAAEARNVRDELSKQVSHEAAGGLPRLEEIRLEEREA